MITCSYGVYKDKQFLGVAAIDIPYSELLNPLEVNTNRESERTLELINTDGENVFGKMENHVDIIEIMGIQVILEMEIEAQNQQNVVWRRGNTENCRDKLVFN